MERITLLALLVTIAVTPASLECVDGNCTEPVAVIPFDFTSLFPFFSPVNFNRDRPALDDALEPSVNNSESNPSGDILSINFMEVISFGAGDESEEPLSDEENMPGFHFTFEKNILDVLGVLDLSGKNMTEEELRSHLRNRRDMGRPVTTLILSNSRIDKQNAGTYAPVEATLEKLVMVNCSIDFDALRGLWKLRFLNMSNNGLTTFPWYAVMKNSLEVLDLSHNRLEEIRPEFTILKNLRELYLSYNRISSVKTYPLELMPNLEVISLTMNSLVDATFTSLHNLKRLDVDWNYLWRNGEELKLPSHRLSVKLASNPWRCDCGILDAKDNYDVMDIDKLQCANEQSFSECDDCQRYFLPMQNGRQVSNLTKDSIEHLGCTGLIDQYYLLRNAVIKLRDHEPEKLVKDIILLASIFGFLIVACVMMCRHRYSKKQTFQQSWLKIQQIPYLKVNKLGKPEEVPYIKINEPEIKA